jgi:hypothetical protein
MPWYNENFDSDLERELDQRKIIANGKKFLDLGAGPATQAIWLAKRGFNVIGSDLSEASASEKLVTMLVWSSSTLIVIVPFGVNLTALLNRFEITIFPIVFWSK